VATVVYSARALDHIERAFSAQSAVSAIQSAVDNLAAHPLVARRLEGELRELIISYGHSGYVALYRFVVSTDEVRILAIRHQREVGFQI
jgi:plasmid stabilization system protein ParE